MSYVYMYIYIYLGISFKIQGRVSHRKSPGPSGRLRGSHCPEFQLRKLWIFFQFLLFLYACNLSNIIYKYIRYILHTYLSEWNKVRERLTSRVWTAPQILFPAIYPLLPYPQNLAPSLLFFNPHGPKGTKSSCLSHCMLNLWIVWITNHG